MGELIKKPGELLGGGSGGKADFAQAGGPNADKLKEAMAAVNKLVVEKLKKRKG